MNGDEGERRGTLERAVVNPVTNDNVLKLNTVADSTTASRRRDRLLETSIFLLPINNCYFLAMSVVIIMVQIWQSVLLRYL